MCIGVSTPLFLAKPLLKSENCPSPHFQAITPIYWFLVTLPPRKLKFFSEPSFLKVTKFLVKISQFQALHFWKFGRRFNPLQQKGEECTYIFYEFKILVHISLCTYACVHNHPPFCAPQNVIYACAYATVYLLMCLLTLIW